jgi:predicted DNA-binding protein (MmcQ/YjbR family)
MKYIQIKDYLLEKPFAELTYPFGDGVSVFKVKNKMFALVGERNDLMMINLKCSPDEGAALRDIYSSITEAYHMNKKHWISVYFDGSIPPNEVFRLIDNSFHLVTSKLTKKDQESIKLFQYSSDKKKILE